MSTRHLVGCARTIRTAVMVTEYLKDRLCQPHSLAPRDSVSYVLKTASMSNDFWAADIVVDSDALDNLSLCSQFVDTCRAFTAGVGEVW